MHSSHGARVETWDIWVRLTHWTVAGIVLWNLFGPTDQIHRVLGYCAAGLVASRLVWGVIGTRPARFSSWWPTRAQLVAYLRSLAAGQALHHASHNPLGALMAAALWFLIAALALSGFVMRLDAFWGEEWPQTVHYWLSVALQGCVVVHIVAAVAMSVWTRENLIAAMITGRKRRRA
jgi:cytochrome b